MTIEQPVKQTSELTAGVRTPGHAANNCARCGELEFPEFTTLNSTEKSLPFQLRSSCQDEERGKC